MSKKGKKYDIDFLIGKPFKKKSLKKGKRHRVNRDKIRYKRRLLHYTESVEKRVMALNQIDDSMHPSEMIKNQGYMRHSIYNYKGEASDMNSMEWRAKFLSLYCMTVMVNFDTIVTNLYEELDLKDVNEWKMKEAILTKMYEDMVSLIKCCIGGSSYKNIMRQSFVYTVYSYPRKNLDDYCRKILDVMDNLETEAIGNGEDIVINDIFLLAYALFTGSTKFNKIKVFEDLDGCSRSDNFSSIITRFGRTLIEKTRRRGIPIMILAFRGAKPKIECDYNKYGKSEAFDIGVLALYFVRTLVDNSYISEVIDDVITKEKKAR